MKQANYSLNIDNVLEYITDCAVPDDEYLHSWLGIPENKAVEVGRNAYNIVWDAIEKEDENMTTIDIIVDLLKGAKKGNYNDPELLLYLYWGFSEIEGHFNPAIEVSLELDQKPPDDFSTN